jgi:hypothetical protein
MNSTRKFVSALSSIVRSVRVAVFTPPPDKLDRPEPRDLICELFRHMPTRPSDASASPAVAEERQAVAGWEDPRSPVVTARRRRGRPRRPVALSARGAAKLRRLLPILATADSSETSLGAGFTKLDTIRALERSIAKARRRGYTLAHIAQALTDNGLPITRPMLGVYLLRISKPTPATHAPPIGGPRVVGARRPDSSVAPTEVDSFESRPGFPPFPLPSDSPFPEHSAAANTNHRSTP